MNEPQKIELISNEATHDADMNAIFAGLCATVVGMIVRRNMWNGPGDYELSFLMTVKEGGMMYQGFAFKQFADSQPEDMDTQGNA